MPFFHLCGASANEGWPALYMTVGRALRLLPISLPVLLLLVGLPLSALAQSRGTVAGGVQGQEQVHGQGQGSAAAPARTGGSLPLKGDALSQYLDRQKKREQERYEQYYGGLARNELTAGQAKARQIRESASARNTVQWSRDTDRTYIPLHERIPGYVPSSLKEGGRAGHVGTGKIKPYTDGVTISPELEMARLKEEMAEEKAEEYRQKGREKQAMVEQAMANMKSQMVDSKVQGAAVLKPNGSSLYVRYYGAEGEKAKPAATSKPSSQSSSSGRP